MINNLTVAILFGGKLDQTIECIESFKGSHLHILGNGVSAEDTEKVINYLTKHKYKFEYYPSKENLGVSKGRNLQIDKIETDWIFFVDNDITIKAGWEEEFKKATEQYPDCKVFIPRLYNKHLGSWEKLYAFSLAEAGKAKTYVVKNGRTNKLSGGASIVHKSLFKSIGGYNEDFVCGFEDFELSIRAIKLGKPIEAIELKNIELIHDHRQVKTLDDNAYLKERYGRENLRKSYELIKKIHDLELPDDGVKWGEKKIEEMSMPDVDAPIRVAIYTYDQVRIGGIETFHKNFVKRLGEYYDITLYCVKGDPDSLFEISQYAEVELYTGQEIETDIFIYGIAWGSLPQKVKAKRYIQMVHGDYEWMKKDLHFDYKKMPNVNEHVAVGRNVQEKFKKMTGYDSTVIYNLLDPDTKPRRLLKLISVMRLGKEKGLERMLKMVEELKSNDIPFVWHVFGDGQNHEYLRSIMPKFKGHQEVVFMGARLNTADYVADADFLVQLSTSEGFSYSIYESLQLGTPCIVTDFPSAYEQVQDGINGIILKMDMSNLDVNKIYNTSLKGFKFQEFSSEEDWIKFLGGNGKKFKSSIQAPEKKFVKVKVLKRYRDVLLNRVVLSGEVLTLPYFRALELQAKNLVIFLQK